MNLKQKTSPTFLPKDALSLIEQSARLNCDPEKTATIVCAYFPENPKEFLLRQLTNETSEEYKAFRKGRHLGMFDIENALYVNAAGGDIYAQAELLRMQSEKEISKAIKNIFFPDIE